MRFHRVFPVVLLSVLAGAPVALAGTPIHIFILAGQSNARGHGYKASSLPDHLKPGVPDVLFWYELSRDKTTAFIDSGDDFVPLDSQVNTVGDTFGNGGHNGYASEITAGRDLLAGVGEEIAFIKFAIGATGIEDAWDPDDGASYFWDLIGITDDALAELTSRGYDGIFSGFIWVQGEWDANRSSHAPLYESRLTHFVQQLRLHLGAPNMKFIISRLHQGMDLDFLATVRAAQEDVAAADPRNFLVSSDDLDLQSDDLHYKGSTQRTLGNRFAALALPDSTPPGLEMIPLTGGSLVWGQYISGNLGSLANQDSSDVVIDSTLSSGDWRAGASIEATSPHTTIDQLRVTLRVEIDEDPVTAGLRARNVSTGQWDLITFFDFDSGDVATLTLDLANPNNYVAGSGKIKLQILSLSTMAAVPSGHELRIDQVKVEVRDN